MLESIKNNPAIIIGIITAVLGLLVSFGLQISADQKAAILALGSVLAGLVTRQFVTGPVTAAKLEAVARVAAKAEQ